MTRYTAFFVALATVLSVATASPVVDQSGSLAKRESHTGKATWFNVGLGACEETDVDSSPVIALSTAIFDKATHCNKEVTITNPETGKTATGQVRDACPGCGADDLDLSPSLFESLGSLDAGVLQIEWDL
ncbi:unnamed protein product [Somion occarium]|uniref:RlpA-like protein double-psi beta-barrel domain-containing protein n=1 Tax=Somion occarium TaxID=3059160 RepID=A0ABP1DZN3_9APHY